MLLRMRIYDTMSNTIRDLKPKDPSKVSIYACGPTVQDVPHLGHARTALTYDVLKRYLVWAGFEVFLVSNITDIDDKIINRALDEGISEEELAQMEAESKVLKVTEFITVGEIATMMSVSSTEIISDISKFY